MPLALAPGISFCSVEGTRIFLDRKRDRYFSFGPATDAAFDTLGTRNRTPEQKSRLQLLVESGILVDTQFGEAPRPCRTAPVTSSPLDDDPQLPATKRAVLVSAVAIRKARVLLKLRGFDHACQAIAALDPGRRHAIPIGAGEQAKIAGRFAAAARLAGAFERCLPISLAMARFCRLREYDVQFVIGVKTRPFQAHAWVSTDGVVLSDGTATTSQFTPILIL